MDKAIENKRHFQRNAGYSLVELIVVIAVIAVILATISYSAVMVFGANAKACANNLQRAIADCKVTAMGKADASLELYGKEGKVFCKMTIDGVEQEEQRLGTDRVSVICEGENAVLDINAGGSLTIRYDRSTGSFAEETAEACHSIVIEGGNKKYELRLIPLTGRTELMLR